MKRTSSLRRRTPIARTRGRKKRTRDPERELRQIVRRRSGGVCEVVYLGRRCWRPHEHTHHIKKRGTHGRATSADALMAVCGPHHDVIDNASRSQATRLNDGQVLKGRMRVGAMLFEGGYACRMDYAPTETKR